jgi:hypothetical protein
VKSTLHDRRCQDGGVAVDSPHATAASRSGPDDEVAPWCSTRRAVCSLVVHVGIVMCAAAGCGGPKTVAPPTNAEAVDAFRTEFVGRIDSVSAAPATAVHEIDLAIESLAGYSASQGEPFSSWLAVAREVRTAWGPNPSKAAVDQGLERLRTLVEADR